MADELNGLLFPGSVAVVGASGTPGKIGYEQFVNVAESFSGPVFAVNPGYKELMGRPCVPGISELPQPVDLAVIIIPAGKVPGALEECGQIGIKNAIVISGGFKETGGEGAELEAQLVDISGRYGINLLGPNCLGLISTQVGLNATFAPRGARPGGIAFLSQSGAFCTSVLDWAWKAHLGFSHFISLGNKAVLSEEDFLAAFAQDRQTKVVAVYLEGVSDGQRFLRTAREVTAHKPVVVIKSGRAEAGARAVSSHTGSLAGSERAYEAAFRQAGVIRAGNVEELFDYAYILARQSLPKGRRVGIVSNAGGPGVMATDAAELEGLEVARFTENTARALAERMPPAANIYNPVDILGDARADRYREAVRLVAGDPRVDMVVALSAPTAILTYAELARILADARGEYEKPITCSFMAGELGEEAEEVLREAGIPSSFDPARAVRALSGLVRYAEIRAAPREEPGYHSVDGARAAAVLAEAKRRDRVRLGVEAMGLLEAYGIATAGGSFARSPEEVKRALVGLGEKVVLKVVSPEMSHKSDVGGVRVGVPAERAAEEAWQMLRMAQARFPEMPLDGILVQEHLPPGVEVIVGMVRDPTFGPLVMFGLGGVHVEVMGDVAFAVAPLSRLEAEELVRSIRAYPVLRGVRGQPGIHMEGLVEVLGRLSQLAVDFPELLELEANPIMCYPDRVVAVDLRLTVSGEGE
ncbi:MAG: acetate--CoA ligase family protein [Candidatus Bipolaricaulota bacterium]